MRDLGRALLRCTALLFPVVVSAQDVARQPTLAGVWKGILHVYPSYIRATLTIGSTQGGAVPTAASIRLQPHRSRQGTDVGQATASIRYDAATRSLDVTAPPGGAFGAMQLHLVYDAERNVLAGRQMGANGDGSPYVVLVREDDEDKWLGRLLDMPSGAATTSSSRFPFSFGSAPSEEKLVQWAGRYVEEYPAANAMNVPINSLYDTGRNLFRDRFFSPHFGKPFDQLPNRDLAKISDRLDRLGLRSSNDDLDGRGHAVAKAMARAFWVNVGTQAAPDLMLSVVALRSIESWRDETVRRLATVPARRGAFDVLQRLESETVGVLASFWPSETRDFIGALDARRRQLADTLLRAAVQQQVAAATQFASIPALTFAVEGLRTTPSARAGRTVRAIMREDIPTLASLTDMQLRLALAGQLQSHIRALVAAEAVRESVVAGESGSSSLDDVVSSAQHIVATEAKYAGYLAVPEVKTLLSRLDARRATVLAANRERLVAAVAATATDAGVDSLTARYLFLPTDPSDADGAAVFAAARARHEALQRAQMEVAAQVAAYDAEQAAARARWGADVAARRTALTELFGQAPLLFDDIYKVLEFVPTLVGRKDEDKIRQFLRTARDLGFSPKDPAGEVYSNHNAFVNRLGHRLETLREEKDNGEVTNDVFLLIPRPTLPVVQFYAAQLRNGMRGSIASTPVPDSQPLELVKRSGLHVRSGAALYMYMLKSDTLWVMARANFDGTGTVVAERVGPQQLRVNSFSRYTDVDLGIGDVISLSASGQIVLGQFAGSATPAGTEGLPLYRRDSRFPLGSLIARVGDGDWFLVGPSITVRASTAGKLQLLVNDREPGNNEGAFNVTYTLTPVDGWIP